MEHQKTTTEPKVLTEEQYNYLIQTIKPTETSKEMAKSEPYSHQYQYMTPMSHYNSSQKHRGYSEFSRPYGEKTVVVPGLITRFPSNRVREAVYFKMSLMIPMNTDQVKIEWGNSPLINPIDVDQQMVTLQANERIENHRRILTITIPYDVGTITTTFTTSKSSFYDQHRHDRDSYYERDDKYFSREYEGGGGNRSGYRYETNKRKR